VQDLVYECRVKQIEAVAITDHDAMELSEEEMLLLSAAGVSLIYGCEMTANCGAHIIGLFISKPVAAVRAELIADHILDQGGLVYIPHPFKEESGLLNLWPPRSEPAKYLLRSATFMELHNAGWRTNSYLAEIKSLASEYSVTLVAGSDSHRPWQVGKFVNEFVLPGTDLKPDMFGRAQVRLMRAEGSSPLDEQSRGRWDGLIKKIQARRLYQEAVKRIPRRLKRGAKEFIYNQRLRTYRQRKPSFTYKLIG